MNSKKDNFRLLEKALKLVPKIVLRKTNAAKRQQATVDLFKAVSKEIQKASKESEKRRRLLEGRRQHPWRICPIGEHWVSDHRRRYSPSSKNYPGTYAVSGTCRRSPTPHDYLDGTEIRLISEQRIKEDFKRPNPSLLDFQGPKLRGDAYDDLIGLWTTYWNETLVPEDLLDPDFVKALIATESGFNTKAVADAAKNVLARGLMQVRDDYPKILGRRGELKDHFVQIEAEDLHDPAIGIATGIRWLFHKKYLREKALRRPVAWREVVAYYKGYLDRAGRVTVKGSKELKRFDQQFAKLKGE